MKLSQQITKDRIITGIIYILPAAYFLVMFLFFPYRNAFWMDHDEGINLVKAQMLNRGYPLYSSIWNDQPPLFTYMIAIVLKIVGARSDLVRTFVLAISSVFMFTFLDYLKKEWGSRSAIIGAFLLLLLPRFADLSVSVMIGLPAIAFAFASGWALYYWYKTQNLFWLIFSGLLMAASALTKLFTVFLIPIYFIGIAIQQYYRYRKGLALKHAILPPLLWGIIVTVTISIPLLIIVGPNHFDQLIGNHLYAARLDIYADPEFGLGVQIREARPVLILCLPALYFIFRDKRWLSLYLLAWTITATIVLLLNKPVWSHQQLLITIPAAFLAAVSIDRSIDSLLSLSQRKQVIHWVNIVSFLTIGVSIYFLAVQGPKFYLALDPTPNLHTPAMKTTSTEYQFLSEIQKRAGKTEWMITDLPIYAFYADLPIPPDLIVFSAKRLTTGNLSDEEIVADIQKYQPGQVLLGRFDLPETREFLRNNYKLVKTKEIIDLYTTEDLLTDEK